jgi:hypothetical protein
MSEWDIKKPLGQCCGTGRPIQQGEEYYAALMETVAGFERRDFCKEFWLQNKPEVYCYWKTKLTAPDRRRQVFIDDDMLMAFFERLADESDAERINFRYVLALVLMRKRRLKYDSSRTEAGREIWRLRIAGEKHIVEVINPQLSEEQVAELSNQISQILQVEI